MKIPVFDIKRQNHHIRKELDAAINQVIEGGVYILGENVNKFESEFARMIGVKCAVGVASGTDAISLALLSIGIGEGDEVIVPANSYPSVFGITAIGAVPRLIDVDQATLTIDVKKLEKTITPKTKAILPVHLYGGVANLSGIYEVIKTIKRKIFVIEDCAQAVGAEIEMNQFSNVLMGQKNSNDTKKKKVGSVGDVGCFSFYPTKNLGAFGDGGMVVTNDERIFEKLKLYRMYGEKSRYQSVLLGRNSRLDEIQAAILLVKMKYLEKWTKSRRMNALQYAQTFRRVLPRAFLQKYPQGDPFLEMPLARVTRQKTAVEDSDFLDHVYHLYVLRSEKRDQLKAYLESKGIGTAIHYPYPIHLVPSFAYLGHKEGDFPESERASREVLSLPMYPELTGKEIEFIAQEISRWAK